MSGFFKKLFSLISYKSNQGLDRLITVQQQSSEVISKIKEEIKILEENSIKVRANLLETRKKHEKTQQELSEFEGYLLKADDLVTKYEAKLAEESLSVEERTKYEDKLRDENNNLTRIDTQINTLLIHLEEYEKAIKSAQDRDQVMKNTLQKYHAKAEAARRTLDVTEIRITSAKAMLATGNGNLSAEILDQIKTLEEQADDLSNLAEATASIEDEKSKNNLEDIAAHYRASSTMSAKERIAQLKEKRSA